MARELDHLEHEVEAARARLKGDLATLTAPSTYSDFVGSVRQTAVEAKNSVAEDVKSKTKSVIEEAVEMAKAKAAANPTAALVIATGLAWHLLKRPPIVAALIGGGLISLARTPAPRGRRTTAEHLAKAKENLGAQATDMVDAAGQAALQAAGYAADKAGEVSGQVREAAESAGQQASEFASAKMAEVSEPVRRAARRLTGSNGSNGQDLQANRLPVPDVDEEHPYFDMEPDEPARLPARDTMLLGAAGLAVAAALAVATQRRSGAADGRGDR
jgi:hypothetical protein